MIDYTLPLINVYAILTNFLARKSNIFTIQDANDINVCSSHCLGNKFLPFQMKQILTQHPSSYCYERTVPISGEI